MKTKDDLGTRMKDYEGIEVGRKLIPALPVYARIDGRSFSNFTRGMDRPYDKSMSLIMVEVTQYLVKETGASVGYTQSDEISLCWPLTGYYDDIMFGGNIQKLTSTLAALATAKFVELALTWFPERCAKRLPTFDARVFQLPNVSELINTFTWRVQDAVKNSIQMAAQDNFSHSELQGKSRKVQLSMLESVGIIWGEYPRFFKEGVFVKRELYWKPGFEKSLGCERSRVVSVELETSFSKHEDKIGLITNNTFGELKYD